MVWNGMGCRVISVPGSLAAGAAVVGKHQHLAHGLPLLPCADLLRNVEWKAALRTLCCMFLGLYCHYWLLLNVSGFQSPWSALLCMLLTRSLLAHPYIHVNIFQVETRSSEVSRWYWR